MQGLKQLAVAAALSGVAWNALGHPVDGGAAAHAVVRGTDASGTGHAPVVTGAGAFTFRTVPGWGAWPAGVTTATHGGVAVAADGRVFVGTESADTGILVFAPGGTLLASWAGDTANAHALSRVVDADGTETLLAAHTRAQKVVRYALDGTVLATLDGADDPAVDLKGVTAVAGLPDGTVFVATGYGASEVFRFAPDGTLLKKAGRRGDAHEDFKVTHGLTIDRRFGEPRLLLADREKGRLVHLSLDLEFLAVHAEGLRRPCVVALRGEHAAVAELQGRVSVLDRDGAAVATLGGNPDETKWAKFKLEPADLVPGVFTAPHGIAFAVDGGLIVQDYYQHGRVTRLEPVAAGAD